MTDHFVHKRASARPGRNKRLAVFALVGLALALLGGWLRAPVPSSAVAAAQPLALASTGDVVSLDMSPQTISRLRKQLADAGQELVVSDDGLIAVAAPPQRVKEKRASDRYAALPALPPLAPGQKPMIAIVIDDLGLVRDRTQATIDLPAPLTLAFLPYAEGVSAFAETAKARGHELLVHMPMEPSKANTDPGPGALLTSLSDEELARRLNHNLTQFSGYAGINNHMGSRFTQSAKGMELVVAELQQRGLFFLDSRTTGASAARDAAVTAQLPYAERDVFLDNHREAPYLALQLSEVERLARRNGSAIAIGHPHAVTVAALRQWLGTLEAKGFELVPVSRIVEQRKSPLWRLAQERGRASGKS
jgi:polysaccharide deacetylase 2 family uncharacterized protein YibQ